MPKIMTLIPARGGSKGIPRKNIALLAGKPLITYSIQYSRSSPLVERTIVSTDDPEIAAVAKNEGAEVPFLRPGEYARDDTQDFPVFLHALTWLKDNQGYVPDIIVHLRPTSPLRPEGLMEKTIRGLLADPDADCLRTVIESPVTPYKTWKIESNYMLPFVQLPGRESYNMPRQDLPRVYWHNGVIDVIRRRTIIEKRSVSGDKIIPLLMDKSFITADIDQPMDLLFAEFILGQTNNNSSGICE